MIDDLIHWEVAKQNSEHGTNEHLQDGTGDLAYQEWCNYYRMRCDAAMLNKEETWADIFAEEVFEVLASKTEDELRLELIQVAALVQRWLDAIKVRVNK